MLQEAKIHLPHQLFMSLYCVNASLCLHHVANLYLHTQVTHKQAVIIYFLKTNFLYKPDSNSLFI